MRQEHSTGYHTGQHDQQNTPTSDLAQLGSAGCAFAPAVLATIDQAEPPTSNTGVEMTQGKETGPPQGQLSKMIDWLTSSFPDEMTWQQVKAWLRLPNFADMPHGRYGYRRGQVCGGITLLYDGNPGMGCCLIITGQGCRELEAQGRVTDWPQFIGDVLGIGGKFTRIDFAYDDRAGYLNLDQVQESLEHHKVNTHFRKWRPIEAERAIGQETSPGRTICIGSRSSNNYIRIYDKAAQQGIEGHWNRLEIEVKGDNAQILAGWYTTRGENAVDEYLNAIIEFKEVGESSERSRWPVAAWWATFIDTAKKLRFRLATEARTVDQVWDWVKRQVLPSLHILHRAEEDGLSTLCNLIIGSGYRVPAWKLARLGVRT